MSALNTQQGGTHYISEYQPIEFINDYNLNFVQGNILKYVVRHKKKNGVEDLKKAMHYCELGQTLKFKRTSVWDGDKSGKVNRFIIANGMRNPVGMRFMWQLCLNHLDVVKKLIGELIEEEYGEQQH